MKKILTTIVAILMTIGVINYVPTIVNADGGTYEPIAIKTSSLTNSTVYGEGDTEWKLNTVSGFYSTYIATVGALPDDGLVTINDTVPYQLTWTGSKPYVGNDSIRMGSGTRNQDYESDTYTLDFANYNSYSKIYILGTVADYNAPSQDSGTITANLIYTDGTSDTQTFTLYDWDTSETRLKNLGGTIYCKIQKG